MRQTTGMLMCKKVLGLIISLTGVVTAQILVSVVSTSVPSGSTLATPTALPTPGPYLGTQSVSLSGPASATICYTTDGTTPTATVPGTCDGNTYSTALSVSSTQTVKAIATELLYTNSSALSASYTILATISCVQGGAGCTNTTLTVNSGCSNTASCTLEEHANFTAGNAIVVMLNTFHAPISVIGNSGSESFAEGAVEGTNGNSIWYVCSTAGGYENIVVTMPSGSYVGGIALELSNAATSSCADGTSKNTADSTSISTGSITALSGYPGDAYFAVAPGGSFSLSTPSLTWSSAVSLAAGTIGGTATLAAYLLSATNASQNGTWSVGGSAQVWYATGMAFKAATK
jgi:hypothetical protein